MKKNRKTGNLQVLKRLMGYLLGEPLLFIGLVVFIAFSCGASIFSIYAISPIINNYVIPLANNSNQTALLTEFLNMLIGLAVILLLGVISTYIYQRCAIRISRNVQNKLRKEMFEYMQNLPINFFDSRTTGEVMSLYTNDMETINLALTVSLSQFINSIITVVGSVAFMFVLNVKLALVFCTIFIIYFIVLNVIGNISSIQFKKQQDLIGTLNGYVEEMYEGQKVVKVFSHEKEGSKNFAKINKEYQEASRKANAYASMLMPIMSNMTFVYYSIMATLGGFLFIGGSIANIGTIGSFLSYSRMIAQPINNISQQFNTLLACLAGANRVFTLLDMEVEIDEGNVTLINYRLENGNITETNEKTGLWAWKIPQGDNTFSYKKLNGNIVFEDVTFSYDEKKKILNDISLYAEPGQKIAFVGSTGAGKTTITKLLNRFYEIQKGAILYDGINIEEIKKDDLRHSIGVVLQDTNLFSGTVMENIRYGNLDATDEEVIEAARLTNADKIIRHLPQGYDTVLEANGSNLSQGQRQLLSIARAAVANPSVLVLDEATSSIDTRTERLIQEGMDKLMKGKTVLVIAHRLSTIRNSNAIMVMEQGEIIERGDHDDLIELRGQYYKLYTGQIELE